MFCCLNASWIQVEGRAFCLLLGLATASKSALEPFVGLLTTDKKPEAIRALAVFIIARIIVLCADPVDVDLTFLAKPSATKHTHGRNKHDSQSVPKVTLPPASFLKKACGFSNYHLPAFCACLENWLLKYPITYAIYDALMCATLGFKYDRGLASPCPDPTPLHFNGSEQIQNANLFFLTFRVLIKKPRLMQVAMGHLNTLVAGSSLAGGCNCATIIRQYDWQIWLFNLLEELTCIRIDDESMRLSDASAMSYHKLGIRQNIKAVFCSLHFFALRSRPKLGLKFEKPRFRLPASGGGKLMRRSGYEVFEESIVLAQV